ncbi:hypothetical protein [Streptosporangium amethystogenes]|nr:hypothetical protein [Streptosporangium amethystogenes]
MIVTGQACPPVAGLRSSPVPPIAAWRLLEDGCGPVRLRPVSAPLVDRL